MRFVIIPLGFLRKGMEKILGKKELENLEADLVDPVTTFADEVYNDTVGDVLRELSDFSKRERQDT